MIHLYNILTYNEYIVEKNRIAVGKIGLTFTTHNNKRQLIITNFKIFEEYRNRGYGTEILKQITKSYKACDLIVCDVDIHNEAAIRFYERLGEVLKDEITEDNKYRVILYEKGKKYGI